MASNAMENLDPKTDQKLRSVHNTIDKLKDSKKYIKDFISASQKMHSAVQAFSQSSKQWGEALQRLATIHTDDIGQALSSIVGRQTAIAEALDGIARSLSVECATPLDSGIDNGARELDTFEKEMKDNRTRLGGDLKKLEAATKKSGKQGDGALIQAMKDFNAKREEIDRFKADQLHTVFLIERRRFGEILAATTKVVNSQIEFSRSITAMEADVGGHTQLLSTLESLSEEQISALSTSAQKAYTSLNTSEAANVTLTGSTNAALSSRAPAPNYGSPRASPVASPHVGHGGPPPPSTMPPPPAGMPPPPNFNPGPPSFEPPPPMGGPPKLPMGGPPKMPSGGPPSGLPPPMASPPPTGGMPSPRPAGGPPPMPGGPPPSNGTMRSGAPKGGPPPMPGGAGSPRPGPPPGPPGGRGPAPSMGGPPPPPMGGPPPPPAGGGPPPPPPGGAPPPPKAPKASSSKPSKSKSGGGGGGGGGGKIGGGDPSEGRSDLLSSISGFKGGLKKTVTNDRSGPILKEDKKAPMGRGGPPMF